MTATASNPTIASFMTVRLSPNRVTRKKIACASRRVDRAGIIAAIDLGEDLRIAQRREMRVAGDYS